MSDILSGLDGVVCDIIIHGQPVEVHDERLVKVLHQLENVGLTQNREKCQFSQSHVRFLGQVIDANGIRPACQYLVMWGPPTFPSNGESPQ